MSDKKDTKPVVEPKPPKTPSGGGAATPPKTAEGTKPAETPAVQPAAVPTPARGGRSFTASYTPKEGVKTMKPDPSGKK